MIKLLTAEEARALKDQARSTWRDELLVKELNNIDSLIRENLKYEVEEVRYGVESKIVRGDIETALSEAGYKVVGDKHSPYIYISWAKGE
jgi:hypothetical protein